MTIALHKKLIKKSPETSFPGTFFYSNNDKGSMILLVKSCLLLIKDSMQVKTGKDYCFESNLPDWRILPLPVIL